MKTPQPVNHADNDEDDKGTAEALKQIGEQRRQETKEEPKAGRPEDFPWPEQQKRLGIIDLLEKELAPKFMNDTFTWIRIKNALEFLKEEPKTESQAILMGELYFMITNSGKEEAMKYYRVTRK